jgi:hypothetical protein
LAGTSFNNLVSQLQGFGNMGETAAGQLGGIATQTGSNIANSFGQVGQAQAAGTLGQANALIGGAGQFANSLGNAAFLGSIGGGEGGTGLYGNINSWLMGLGQGGLTGAGRGQQ